MDSYLLHKMILRITLDNASEIFSTVPDTASTKCHHCHHHHTLYTIVIRLHIYIYIIKISREGNVSVLSLFFSEKLNVCHVVDVQ